MAGAERNTDSEFVFTVCEVGFNMGHSSLNWLLTDEAVRVVSFDLGDNAYTRHGAAYLKERFGAHRLELVVGDSAVTVPAYKGVQGGKGGHNCHKP